ncbi:MAG: putative membrane protein [Lentisphaeria bacterium]|jgi:uncharacterized membrane protein
MDSKVSINKKAILSTTLAGLVAAGLSVSAQAVPDQPTAWEKCAGIAKAGKNDCGALDGSHVCAGQAAGDNLDVEWVYVPQGSCDKITGGVVKKVKPAKKA